jgi:hypothetical protein
MTYLVERNEAEDRAALLNMVRDPGADVRLAWAELMGRHKWSEAEPLLVSLLSDDRDFSLDRYHGPSRGWPRYLSRGRGPSAGRIWDADRSLDPCP